MALTITVAPASETSPKQLYVGTELGVFMTCVGPDDESVFWFEANGTLPYVVVNDMRLHPDDEILQVATFGRGVWEVKRPKDVLCPIALSLSDAAPSLVSLN